MNAPDPTPTFREAGRYGFLSSDGYPEEGPNPLIKATVREAGDEGIAAVLTDATCACGHPVWGGWHKRKIGCEADDCPCLLDAPAALAPLIAERERAAGERALREAADEVARNTFVSTDLDVTRWLHDRAAALAPETPEAGQS